MLDAVILDSTVSVHNSNFLTSEFGGAWDGTWRDLGALRNRPQQKQGRFRP